MNNWKIIFATVVIFGAGVITGGMLVNCIQHCTSKAGRGRPAITTEGRVPAPNSSMHPTEEGKPHPPEAMSKLLLQRLDEELQLTAEQHKAVQKIINEGQNQIRKVIHDQRLEIREVLTPAQLKQFDELVKHPFHRPPNGTNASAAMPQATNCVVNSTNAP